MSTTLDALLEQFDVCRAMPRKGGGVNAKRIAHNHIRYGDFVPDGQQPRPPRPTMRGSARNHNRKQPEGSAAREFWGRVERLQASGVARANAISRVVKDDPELHQEYLAEHNEKHGRNFDAR